MFALFRPLTPETSSLQSGRSRPRQILQTSSTHPRIQQKRQQSSMVVFRKAEQNRDRCRQKMIWHFSQNRKPLLCLSFVHGIFAKKECRLSLLGVCQPTKPTGKDGPLARATFVELERLGDGEACFKADHFDDKMCQVQWDIPGIGCLA